MAADFRGSPKFPDAALRSLNDAQLRANLRQATTSIRIKRDRLVAELPDFEELRAAAAAIKDEAQANMASVIQQVEHEVTSAGGHVHFASTAAEANQIVIDIATKARARNIVKVKSMTTGEIGLNGPLEAAGASVTETDLAELIVQLADDLPSHIVVPAIHRNRAEIKQIFSRHMGQHGLAAPSGLTDQPEDLAAAARAHLRQKFFEADMAISGANFVVADNGAAVVVESEGNGRMCLTLPPLLVTIAGIDKIIPRFSDLEVFLQLLARSATGERMNPYTSIWRGVVPGDGPDEFHLVLLDNGRTSALADPVGRQALRCIRCAACLNVCPVYERVGGHAYGSVYPGPIGAVLTPQLDRVAAGPVERSLPFASSLCGACYDVCPVRIDIPRLLVHLRAKVVEEERTAGPSVESVAMAAAAEVMASSVRMRLAERIAGRVAPVIFRQGRVRRLPGALSGWTDARDGPLPARQSFRDWWDTTHGQTADDMGPPPPTTDEPSLSTSLLRVLRSARPPTKPRLGASGPSDEGGRQGFIQAVQNALARAPMSSAPVPRAYRMAGAPAAQGAVGLFVERTREYRADLTIVDAAGVSGAVDAALQRSGAARVIVAADLPQSWLPPGPALDFHRDTGGLTPVELDGYDAAITTCAVAVAKTGTVVLDGGPGQGRRALSLVPDHLVVVVHESDIVANVPDAIARLGDAPLQTWISGPSATSDIELKRVEGVHGPRRLDVIVVATGPASS